MTDNEIIKALEHEIHIANDIGGVHSMMIPIEPIKCALDLINRQQAEIERLTSKLDKRETELDRLTIYFDEMVKAKLETKIKEFAEMLCEGRVSNDPVVIAVKAELKSMEE